VVVYHESHVIHPTAKERPRPSCSPPPPSSSPSVILNSLPASPSTAAAAVAAAIRDSSDHEERQQQQQQQLQRTNSGGNQSSIHSESQFVDSNNNDSSSSAAADTSDNSNSSAAADTSDNSNSSAAAPHVKFSPDFRNQLYESLDAASLAAHGIMGKRPAEEPPATPAFSKMRRSADGLYGGPQQAAPHVADYGIYENRKTTCLLYLQVRVDLTVISRNIKLRFILISSHSAKLYEKGSVSIFLL